MDIPVEELFEDFENKDVEIDLVPRCSDPPIYTGLVKDWESTVENDVDPDYQFCSEEGYEKFLDMKLGLMVNWGLYTHLGTLESWAVNGQNAPHYFFDIYYTLWQMWESNRFQRGKMGSISQTRRNAIHPNYN